MVSIPVSASEIGTLEAQTGCRTRLWCDTNRNTGEPRMYVDNETIGRVVRLTGRNLEQWLVDINDMLNEGAIKWMGECNTAALTGLARAAGRPDLLS